MFSLVQRFHCIAIVACVSVLALAEQAAGDDSLSVWPDLAPRETSRDTGVAEPLRPNEIPPIMRITKIRRPTLDVFLADKPNGTAILVLPGGGFGKVVPDKEGSEAAAWLNPMGVSTFVLRYRTNEVTPKDEPAWQRPLEDAQRALRLIRANHEKWHLNPEQVGVLGFSAGGQVASILHTANGDAMYPSVDAIDDNAWRPNFSLLIYPWRVLDDTTGELLKDIQPSPSSPPAFIVHTHDDASSSLGSVLIYAGLKRSNVDAELHVYENGGHGYGMRPVAGSSIGTWPDRAGEWLVRRGLARRD